MDEDLKTWATRQTRSEKEWFSCLIQLFFAVGAMHQHLGLSHTDLHWGNVLVRRLSPRQSWTYKVVEGEHYSLPDQEYLFTICDFGCAQFDARDEMKDYRRIALNVFKWLGKTPGDVLNRFVSEIHSMRNRRWKSVLDLVVSKYVSRHVVGDIFDGTRPVEFFVPEK
jgi:predicted unusual protein kinase regulating ubiquinone biosynthesis (AarF/ABC1/UbiB family)